MKSVALSLRQPWAWLVLHADGLRATAHLLEQGPEAQARTHRCSGSTPDGSTTLPEGWDVVPKDSGTAWCLEGPWRNTRHEALATFPPAKIDRRTRRRCLGCGYTEAELDAKPASSCYCADGRHIPAGHEPEDCAPCLRAMRDGIRREYEANVNVDLLGRLREMDRRIDQQRRELARLNAIVAGPRSPETAAGAFEAWCMPLERSDRRFASVVFRAGWQAARRALRLVDDASTHQQRDGK